MTDTKSFSSIFTFSELLKIIGETESDDLTSVMQKIVCVYQEQIAPLALEICTHLVSIGM